MSVPHETSHGIGNGPPQESDEASDPRRHLAVALRYERERKTPIVVAKGSGLVADAILKQARDAGVFVHSSRELIDLLMKVDLDARIPPSLYVAVAEVLSWVYRQDERAAARVAGELPGTGTATRTGFAGVANEAARAMPADKSQDAGIEAANGTSARRSGTGKSPYRKPR